MIDTSAAPLRTAFARHPIARESMIAVALVGAFGLWLATTLEWILPLVRTLDVGVFVGGGYVAFAVQGALMGVVALVIMLVFVGPYVLARDVDVQIGRFDRSALPYAADAVLAGIAGVAVVKAVAVATGSSLSAVVGMHVAADAAFGPFLLITGLGLLVTVPAVLLTTHVLVQRTLDRATADRYAIVLTVLVVGLIGPSRVLQVDPFPAVYATVVMVLTIALPVVARTVYEWRWLTALTAVPLVMVGVLLVMNQAVDLAGVADAVHTLVEVGVLTVGVVAYQRTRSMVPTALGFATVAVASAAVVFALEAGVGT